MRLNKYIAQYSWLSRRAADTAIEYGRVKINGVVARVGQVVLETDTVMLDDKVIGETPKTHTYIMMNKPVGYVCSRNGQSSPTIYSLLPPEHYRLNPVGRLDKDSSGLLLLSDDGDWIHSLAHPAFGHRKQYLVKLNKQLTDTDRSDIQAGVMLEDGMSHLDIKNSGTGKQTYIVTMTEGRNRQIRRTFGVKRYMVTELHRTVFGKYTLSSVQKDKHFVIIDK